MAKETLYDAEVLGKNQEKKGLIFKKTVYLVALRVSGFKEETVTYEVPFDQFCIAETGEKVRLKIYHTDSGGIYMGQKIFKA